MCRDGIEDYFQVPALPARRANPTDKNSNAPTRQGDLDSLRYQQ